MNLGIMRKVYVGFALAVALVFGMMLVGCTTTTNSGSSDSTETTTNTSVDDEWTKVDLTWSYKADGDNTILKRSDGYQFTVKTQCGATSLSMRPDEYQNTTTFGTHGSTSMSFDIVNDEDSIQKQYKYESGATSNGVIEGTGSSKAYFSHTSNQIKIYKEDENLWIKVIYGSEIITEERQAQEVLDYFQF